LRSASISTDKEKRVEEAIAAQREIVSLSEEGLPEAPISNAHGIAKCILRIDIIHIYSDNGRELSR